MKVGDTTYDKVYIGIFKSWILLDDGSNWMDAITGTGSNQNYRGIGIGAYTQDKECGIAIGDSANGVKDAVSIGYFSDANDYGTAIGYSSVASDKGVALGHSTSAIDRGTALGYGANTNDHTRAIALGYWARNQRRCEIAMMIGDIPSGGADMRKNYNQIVIGSWIQITANATPILMYVDGSATERFNIRAQSALTFKIMVTARDNTSGDCAAYLFDGLIKRDGANNTTLCVCNKTALHEDDDTWDCDVAADDTNEALQITVTGDADNTVKWAARLDGVETSWTAIDN